MRCSVTITLFLLAGVAAHQSGAAGFDCARASTSIERLICTDPELSNLDEQMSVIYGRALALEPKSEKLRSEQRKWLQGVRDKCANSKCLKKTYESRLAALEEIAGSFDSVPPTEHVASLCKKLADPQMRSVILKDTGGIEDINNDGKKERSEGCSGGTMHVPCTRYFDVKGNEIVIETVGYEWKDYWTYGQRIFRNIGRTWSIHSYDDHIQKPAYVSYVTPSNKEYVVCKFNNDVHPVVSFAEEGYERICDEVLANKGDSLSPVSFDKPSNDPKPLPENSWERIEDSGLVDINNDGRKEWLAEVRITSGAGRGCDANRFVFVGKDGNLMRESAEQRQLDVMQGEFSISCGSVSNRLLQIRGKTYLESNLGNNELFQHALSLWTGNEVRTVCVYKTGIRTTVK